MTLCVVFCALGDAFIFLSHYPLFHNLAFLLILYFVEIYTFIYVLFWFFNVILKMIYVVFCSSFVHLLLHLCLVSNCEELFFILFLFIYFCFGFVVSSPCCPHIPCVAEGGGDGLGLVYQTKLMHSSCNSFFKCWCACVRYSCECEKDVSVVVYDSFQELENVFCIF